MMKPLYLTTLILLAPFALQTPALALAQDPADAAADASDMRLLTLPYNPDGVVRLQGCINFQTMVGFEAGETIENVGLGDSSQWQVTPNKKADLLFVKPLVPHAFSNMSIVTNKRAYNFELRSAPDSDCAKGRVVYTLRFAYPPEAPAGTVTAPSAPVDPNAFLPLPEKRNNAYTYSGDVDLVPMRAFDDGVSTYFKWSAGISTPAVYALNADNSESIVNYASRGDYFVVEQVAPAFVLRRGDEKAVLYNDSYVVQGLDALSPKPRDKSQGVVK